MSLYLKYRPQNFATVVGQNHVVLTLKNALERNSLAHAYLFAGTRGTGKTSLARITAKALNCLKPENAEPCNACDMCENINNGRLVDLIEIDAASNRGIDEIRDLKEKIEFAPSQAKTKVYIIDEVHMLTKEAFNALLKTLEEPPEHAYFILATTEAHKIPETIISRCQQFNFKRIDIENIKGRLSQIAKEEGIEAEENALGLIARSANGGLRDAIGLLEQMNVGGKVSYEQTSSSLGLTGAAIIETFYSKILNQDISGALEVIEEINAKGLNLHQFTGEFIAFLREQMLLSVSKGEDSSQTIEMIECFSKAKNQISQALLPQLPIEIAVIKSCNYHEVSQAPQAPTEVKVEKVAEPQPPITEAPKPTPVVATEESVELTIENIKQNWQRVLDNVETPFIRKSLQNGEPVKYEGGKLHLKFTSATFKEKVASSANQNSVQKAFEAVFKTPVPLHMEVSQVELKPVSESKETPEGEPSLVDMAKEVFGVN